VSAISTNTRQHRASCILTREARPDGAVFVKQYLEGDAYRSQEVIRDRTALEAKLLNRLSTSDYLGGRLGVLQIIDVQPLQATITMAEVKGESLSDVLENRRMARGNRQSLAAVYLAGKWLRRFQSLPADECEKYSGTYGVDDIIEYCELRIRRIRESGDSWLSASLHQRITGTLAKLVKRSSKEDLSFVWSHGDYGPHNMIWDGHGLTPIDFAMAHADFPLADVTYFAHGLQMVRTYRPWRRWPIDVWKRAFLRGYDRPNAAEDPMYRVCMIRHVLCGLSKRQPSKNWKQSLHNRWVQGCLRRTLEHYCS
jgi:tRNA A-37 threonylcarbamoyl transferase component Bud32